MPSRCIRLILLLCLPWLLLGAASAQKTAGVLRGQVTDPSGAIIPGASITLTGNGKTLSATSGASGSFGFNGVPAGKYTLDTTIEGFTPYEQQGVAISGGKASTLNIPMTLAVQQQEVHVEAEGNTIDTTPESNANALVMKGKDLDALSDDPDELASEIQALAGPAAGPNGGQIYVDGFSGGEIPPKSSIREIRVNENPFSAEYDRLGYGRIEILTKPGTDKIRGHIFSRGNYSGFNAQNPILNANLSPGQPLIQEPSYYSYFINGNVGGPITNGSSYFVNAFNRNTQNVEVVNAINPASITAAQPNGLTLNEAISNPMSRTDVNPRIDLQLGNRNTLTARYSLYRVVQTNDGIGPLTLPEQGYNIHNEENQIQASDSLVLTKSFVDNLRFQYRHIRDDQAAQFTSPTVRVRGTFTDGGSNAGTVKDAQDDFELQDYLTGQKGAHTLNFGTRLRAYADANYTNAGTNGAYVFQAVSDYLNRTPQQYQVTVVNNNQYTARAVLFDAALFYQDDWKINQRFTFSYGARWETQNYIHDKNDWAPRVYLAYALGHGRPKTVLRAGYGWFYERFTVPNGSFGVPYILQTIHNNLPANPSTPSNQQIYTLTNPTGYTETSPGNAIKPANPTSSSSAPTYWTLAPNFHAAVDMQGAVGVDRQIARNITGNVTYLYSRGVHQYLSNNITAPFFNGHANVYPATPLAPSSTNIYQFQSGAVYRQDQVIATVKASLRRLSLFSFYTYSKARGDTSSVFHFASNASDPGQDYGRTAFDIRNRFLLLASYNAPHAFTISPMFVYNSGIPYDIKIGSDLTANNQFDARPTFANPAAACAAPLVKYGPYCLNPNPVGTNQQIIPYGLGTGPSNYSLNMRVSKVIGFGPRLKTAGHGGPGFHHGGPGLGGRGLSGNAGGPGRMDAAVPRKYNLTLSAFGENLFNHENLGVPNGTLDSAAFFGKSQSLARGFFNSHTAGNRSIFLQTAINF